MPYLATRMLEATAHIIAPAVTSLSTVTGQLRMVDYPMTGKYSSLYSFCPSSSRIYMLFLFGILKELNALDAVQRFSCRVCTKRWYMRGDDYLKCVTSTRSSTGLLTQQMHIYCSKLLHRACTSSHPSATSDSHYFSRMLQLFGIVYPNYDILTSPSINMFKRSLMVH